MTFADDILPDLDDVRGIGGELGLRPFTVKVVVRTWTGARPGLPGTTYTDAPTILTVAAGSQTVKATAITNKDIVSSGGQYTDQDIKVGPITPAYAATYGLDGGYQTSQIDPATTATAREVFWNVAGPGMPAGGGWCDKIGQEVDSALHYYAIVRRNGKQP